jgi:hypothetical protein
VNDPTKNMRLLCLSMSLGSMREERSMLAKERDKSGSLSDSLNKQYKHDSRNEKDPLDLSTYSFIFEVVG